MKIFSYISSFFLQNKCFGCQKSGHFFCPQCNEDLEVYYSYCYVCKKTSDNFLVHKECLAHFPIHQVIVLTRYRFKGIKRLLRHAKYYGKYSSYSNLMLKNKDFFLKYIDGENSIFIPVPMHFLRRWKRGYNQSEKIAQNLSKICKTPVNNNFIVRSKYTKQQSHLGQSGRAKNLSGVFSLKSNAIDKDTTLYLVDDVISTGATVLEITRLLQKNGYKNVRVICLASD